jgi:ethanolamine utilization protein EutP
VVDTPGEYAEQRTLAHALALYAYECDVVGFLIAANEPYSLFEPGCAACANRPVIGIITKVNAPDANLVATENWLRIAGVKDIFHVDSVTGEGLAEIFEYLAEEGDQLPWLAQKRQKEQKDCGKQPQNNKKPKSSTQKPQKTAKK